MTPPKPSIFEKFGVKVVYRKVQGTIFSQLMDIFKLAKLSIISKRLVALNGIAEIDVFFVVVHSEIYIGVYI